MASARYAEASPSSLLAPGPENRRDKCADFPQRGSNTLWQKHAWAARSALQQASPNPRALPHPRSLVSPGGMQIETKVRTNPTCLLPTRTKTPSSLPLLRLPKYSPFRANGGPARPTTWAPIATLSVLPLCCGVCSFCVSWKASAQCCSDVDCFPWL